MITTIKTKYANGVFQPLEKVNLPEGSHLILHIEDTIPIIDNETREWLDTAALDTADRMATLETNLPEDEVANWYRAMTNASKPARYVPQKGIVIE